MTAELILSEIRAEMARQRLSQVGLAARLQEQTGRPIHSVWVNRRMTGDVSLTLDDFFAIAEALGLAPDRLLARTS